MMLYPDEPPLPESPPPAGVLIGNLGSPAAATPAAVRIYLRQILGDPRIVEAPRLLWWLLLNTIIVPRRCYLSARLYRKIWSDQGSPLLVTTQCQASAVQESLQLPVAVGMRYGEPSVASGLQELRLAGCRRILILPLFPQASATSSGSYFDQVSEVLRGWRWVPELRTVSGYHEDSLYIDALAASIRAHQATHGSPERLLISFHGIPHAYAEAGDPYPDQCRTTAELLARRLQLGKDDWQLSFQSRLGRARWLGPYTDQVLAEWGGQGLSKVDVICPGFSADCLETLEEIAIGNRRLFIDAGGGDLRYVPALNHRPDHIETIVRLAQRNLGGWVGSITRRM
jgi:ferrochelatase